MALINCPACRKEISDKAENCPNCGHPINAKKSQATKTPYNKVNNPFHFLRVSNNPYIRWIIRASILLFATLPFHYIPSHLMVFPKDHFTFSYTFITQDDIDNLVKRYNNASFFERNAMNNEPIVRKLKEKGIIYDKKLQDNEEEK